MRRPHRELLLLGLAALASWGGGCHRERPERQPNILLIETDDQRWDTLWAMPRIRELLADRGVEFTHAVASNPLCCPSRASLLAGGYYSHNVGVLAAEPPNGGAERFDDRESLAVALQRQGYRTALVGKYLNGYEAQAPRVPPGWDLFFTRLGPPGVTQRMLRGRSTADAPGRGRIQDRRRYLTYQERDEALAFLAEAPASGKPFFLWLAFHAPHRPALPAPEDTETFAGFDYRDRAWGEADLSDKPGFVARLGQGFVEGQGGLKPLPGQPGFPADFPRAQVRALQAVDRSVGEILDRLEALALDRPTVVLFSSDNGILWGEHRLYRKALPYEEAIRVPLLVRMPGVPAGKRDHLVAIDLDLAPTILELVGLRPEGDGASLLPILRDPEAPWRQEVFLESFGLGEVPPWAAVRTRSFKYVEYADGERELYDLEQDPFEQQSRHDDPALAPERIALARAVGKSRGLAFAEPELPAPRRNEPYRVTLPASGGRPPYTWEVEQGRLPPGLSLDPRGSLAGVPTGPAQGPILLRVTDSSASPRDGRPQSFRRFVQFGSTPAREGDTE